MSHEAIYPGTFDPLTLGHLDVIDRAGRIFDRLIVAVAIGRHKSTLFSVLERVDMIQKSVEDLENVNVESFDNLLVEYAREKKIQVVIRGLRAFSDFEFEFQMALTNRNMAPDVETLFLMPKEDYSYLSSTTVKEISALGGDIDNYVPPSVAEALNRKNRS